MHARPPAPPPAPVTRRPGDVVSRRRALGVFGAMGLTATGAAAAETSRARSGRAESATRAAVASPAPTGNVREFVLTASEFDWDLMPGERVRAWGYNGQVPGPELRVTEGDRVRVTLKNELPVPTTIHWHGVYVPPAMDGPAGLNQAPVPPGQEFVYEFTATPSGSRWYHSHADPANQVPLGLYGPLIVEPRVPNRTYAHDYTYMLAEWDAELTPAVAAGTAPPGPGDRMLRGGEQGADYFLMNGHMHSAIAPIRLATGDQILIRLMHAGAMPHAFHTHGHSFKIVATDGNPVPEAAQLTKDTVLIGPGERYDLEIEGDHPGVWMVHCHMEPHMDNGMMTLIIYDGAEPSGPVPLAAFDSTVLGATTSSQGMSDMDATPTEPATAVPTPAVTAVLATNGAAEIEMVDNRFVPNVLTVAAGTTVTWVNKGRNWHTVSALDGSFASDQISPGQSFSHQLTKPGTYQYICQHHVLQGMTGVVTVR